MTKPPPAPHRVAPRRAQPGREHNSLAEIRLGPNARTASPEIIEQDDLGAEIVRMDPDAAFTGRVYIWWMEHSDDGGCSRTDAHEDVAYVGKSLQPLWARWAQHLARDVRRPDGSIARNRSAVYRHRARITGVSVDPRIYPNAAELSAAEVRAIRTLWPAWNIQEQDRRNPYTRATRAYRQPDRLAPWVGLREIAWGIFAVALTALAVTVLIAVRAPWPAYLIMCAASAWTTGGTRYLFDRARGKARARRDRRNR